MPSLDAITLVPMFPHTLTSRPVVIGADKELRMRVSDNNRDSLQVSCDSHVELPVQPGDDVYIRKSGDTLRMVHPESYDYFAVLRKKLNWGSKPF
jgi:NAD+ kinase